MQVSNPGYVVYTIYLALHTSLLGVKTLHRTAEVADNMTKASGWEQEVAVLGMTVDARAQAKHWLPIDWMGVSNPGYVVYTIYDTIYGPIKRNNLSMRSRARLRASHKAMWVKPAWLPYSLDQTPRLLKVSRLCVWGDKLGDWGQVPVSTS